MPTQETVRPVTNPKLSSLDKIAIFLLSLPSNEVEKIFLKLNAYEIKSISQRMAVIGSLNMDQVEELYLEFAEKVEKLTNKPHSFESVEKILKKFFDPLKIRERIEESQEIQIAGLSETLKDINPTSLATYLKNEHPQTISLILSKIDPQKAASVFIELPEALAMDVMNRMLTMGQVHQEMLTDVENTLKAEFENVLTPKVPQDSCAHMADIFNAFDSKSEVKFMQELESKNSEAAKRIKSLILTIEDLKYVEGAGIKTILSIADKGKLVVALKGVSESLKEIFFHNMSERAAKLLKDEIIALDMVKVRTVYEAQQEIVSQAKELIRKGEIHLNKTLLSKRV